MDQRSSRRSKLLSPGKAAQRRKGRDHSAGGTGDNQREEKETSPWRERASSHRSERWKDQRWKDQRRKIASITIAGRPSRGHSTPRKGNGRGLWLHSSFPCSLSELAPLFCILELYFAMTGKRPSSDGRDADVERRSVRGELQARNQDLRVSHLTEKDQLSHRPLHETLLCPRTRATDQDRSLPRELISKAHCQWMRV
jgi:hypothetical protein